MLQENQESRGLLQCAVPVEAKSKKPNEPNLTICFQQTLENGAQIPPRRGRAALQSS
jgi:hypothetical protein